MKLVVIEDAPIYSISENGIIINNKTGRTMKTYINGGYKRVGLRISKGKEKKLCVHRLLMKAYRPIDNHQEMVVNHINNNSMDNRLENLEWCTPKENANHYHINFRPKNKTKICKNLFKYIMSKYSPEEVEQKLLSLINDNAEVFIFKN